jgi:glycosyltransferase involved in cell wall biosynthesis
VGALRRNMKIWVIAPVGSDRNIANLAESFRRQEYQEKGLIVVENGEGFGACAKYNFKPDAIIRSNPPNQAIAKNLGVTMVRQLKGEFWATMDDDDYYGPKYLTELAFVAPKADIIGKQWNWVEFDDGLWLFRGDSHDEYSTDVQGPTIAAWTAVSVPFKEHLMICEDMQFCKDMVDAGARVYRSSSRFFCYNRKSGVHRWPAAKALARKKMGNALFFGKVPYDICDDPDPKGGIFVPADMPEEKVAVLCATAEEGKPSA